MRPLCASALLAALTLAVTPASPAELGLNVHQSAGVGLDVTADAMLGWVRIDFNWYDAQPSPAAPDFTAFDALVDAAIARNLKVLAVIGYTPAWASSGDGKGDGALNDVPVAGAYADFVTASVEHFKDRVTHWELWNEPNLDVFFEGTPGDYTDVILGPGADAVHAACSGCKVVAPGLASIAGMYDVWLDAALTAHKAKIDIVSGHVYAGFPPGGLGTTSDSFLNKLETHRVLKVGETVVYEGPLSFREVMQKHGVTAPFWMTETGQEATLGEAAAEAAQTDYYRHVLETMLSRPWWEATIFYESFDEPGSGYTWGIAVHDDAQVGGYAAKPVMGLLQKVVEQNATFGGAGRDCDDGLDNEGDGLVDFPADPECSSILATSEGGPPVDGGVGGGGGAGGDGAGTGGNGSSGDASGGGTSRGCACETGNREHAGDHGGAIGLGFAVLAAARLRGCRRRTTRRRGGAVR